MSSSRNNIVFYDDSYVISFGAYLNDANDGLIQDGLNINEFNVFYKILTNMRFCCLKISPTEPVKITVLKLAL